MMALALDLRNHEVTKALSTVLLLLACFTAGSHAQPPANQRAILVTGASTGIGRKITERLAAHGYFVYAGARKDADLASLKAIPDVQAIRLDVTKAEDIDAAIKAITLGGRGLYGLVNNAGIASWGPLVDMSPEEFDLTMRVNLYGPYRITRAFAPLDIMARHREAGIQGCIEKKRSASRSTVGCTLACAEPHVERDWA